MQQVDGIEAVEKRGSKPPWKPQAIAMIGLLFSFGAAGILAGINWRRLNKSERTWSTILLSLFCLGLMIIVFTLVPLLANFSRTFIYVINFAVAAMLAYWQRPAYEEWIATYGEPSFRSSGIGIPLIVGIGTMAGVLVFSMFIYDLRPLDPAIEHYNQGVEYHQQDRPDLALEEYTQAIEINPQLEDAYFNRGSIYYHQGQYELTVADFDQVLEINPENAEAHHGRGIAHAILGNGDEAIYDLNRANALESNNARYHFARGTLFFDLGMETGAMQNLERALEIGLEAELRQIAEVMLEDLGQ